MTNQKYDVFLSYAFEDKIELANELCQTLEQKGLRVWYAGNELIPGESIEKTINAGLKRSRFGIILITPTYFEKKWTVKELYALMSREHHEKKNIIIPVIHKITPDEVAVHDKLLSDRWALNSDLGLDNVASKIVERVQVPVKPERENETRSGHDHWKKWLTTFLLFSLLTAVVIYYRSTQEAGLGYEVIERAVKKRIEEINLKVEEEMEGLITQKNALTTNQQSLMETYEYMTALNTRYRNFYEFSNGIENYKFLKY
ncbi:MAG: toll/interleukin-1 receptor domain-containing protein, partial [Bacteroidota bacterium]